MRTLTYTFAMVALASLTGCVEEPTVKDAENAVTALEQDEVKKEQLSIEQAAEEATKLIEEDARQETETDSANLELLDRN